VETGRDPSPFGVEAPRPRIEAVRVVDMSFSNAWAEKKIFGSAGSIFRPQGICRLPLIFFFPGQSGFVIPPVRFSLTAVWISSSQIFSNLSEHTGSGFFGVRWSSRDRRKPIEGNAISTLAVEILYGYLIGTRDIAF